MRILITGAGGLMGSHLVPLLEKGHEVFTISKKINDPRNFNIDFSKPWSTDTLPPGLDAIIHLAQSEDFRDFPNKAREVFYINTASTMDLIDFAVKTGVKKFVYASSGGLYGNSDEAFTEEQEIIYKKGMGFYLGTKHCSEVILNNYTSLMDIQQLRFFFVYGKGQRRDMLIPRMLDNVLQGRPITLAGNEGLRINPIHVMDAAKSIVASMEMPGSNTINVGGPDILSLREIAETIGAVIGKTPQFVTDRRKEPMDIIGDISKMSNLLYKPHIRFKEGITSLI